jgi:hypothetical protein
MQRITEENENLLKRLQEKQSNYNVFEWELDRKKQVKMLKKICYYPPSLTKKSRLRSKRHHGKIDPNFEVFQYYQQNLKTVNNGALSQGFMNGEEIGEDDQEPNMVGSGSADALYIEQHQ